MEAANQSLEYHVMVFNFKPSGNPIMRIEETPLNQLIVDDKQHHRVTIQHTPSTSLSRVKAYAFLTRTYTLSTMANAAAIEASNLHVPIETYVALILIEDYTMAVIRVYPVLTVASASARKWSKMVLLSTGLMKPLQPSDQDHNRSGVCAMASATDLSLTVFRLVHLRLSCGIASVMVADLRVFLLVV
jgi:hypothetical protein